MSRWIVLVLTLGLTAPRAARAQEPLEPEVAALRERYEHGRYAEVLERAALRVNRGRLVEEDMVELHKLAGLSAFHLNRMEDASRHFRALLWLNPDFTLDPFVVPPPAVAFLDHLREQLGAELERVRQERRLRQERERAEAERRERERVAAEEQRRRLEELSRQVMVRQVEKRSFMVNFVPFGAGQFQQGRNGVGLVFAATEGALALTSIISFFAYESLFEEGSVLLEDVLTETGRASVPVRYIPTMRAREADVWRMLKVGSAVGFYSLYALGVADALYHHQDQVVTSSSELLPALVPESVRPPVPGARLHLFSAPGGAGAGFTLSF